MAQAGADTFTVGSAAFAGSFSTRKGLLANQPGEILAASGRHPPAARERQ